MKQDPRDREGRATTTTDLTMGRHQERPVVNETRSPAAVRRPAAARQPAAAGGEQEEQAQKTRPADSPTTDFTMEDLKLAARYIDLNMWQLMIVMVISSKDRNLTKLCSFSLFDQ